MKSNKLHCGRFNLFNKLERICRYVNECSALSIPNTIHLNAIEKQNDYFISKYGHDSVFHMHSIDAATHVNGLNEKLEQIDWIMKLHHVLRRIK